MLGCNNCSNIVIPSSVKEIGEEVFPQTRNIINIEVDSKNQYFCIEDGILFSKDKTRLLKYPRSKANVEYIIPETVTKIDKYAFFLCDNLEKVTIPNGITRIDDGAFACCNNLAEVNIPNSVTTIGRLAFWGCYLPSITIPDSVTSIEYGAFNACVGLSSIEIPSSVTNLRDGMFTYCRNLNEVKVEETNPKYCVVDGVLYDKELKRLIVFPLSNSSVSYTLPETVISIDEGAFIENDTLAELTIPASVTSIGEHAFYNCRGIKSVSVSPDNQYYSSLDGVLFNKNKTDLILYPMKKETTDYQIPNGVTEIRANTFESNTFLTNVEIPNTVTNIGMYAFQGCSSLVNVEMPDSVTRIERHAFWDCDSLTNVNIPASVTSIGIEVFRDCDSLLSINVDENNNQYCSLEGVLFNKNVTDILAYPRKKETTEYKIPDGITEIDSFMFHGCDNLTKIEIPDSVTSIWDNAFENCSSLTTIYGSVGSYAETFANAKEYKFVSP